VSPTGRGEGSGRMRANEVRPYKKHEKNIRKKILLVLRMTEKLEQQ